MTLFEARSLGNFPWRLSQPFVVRQICGTAEYPATIVFDSTLRAYF